MATVASPSMISAVARRLYALSPIVLALYTTLATIEAVAKLLAITRASPNNMVASPLLEVINYDTNLVQLGSGWYSCDAPVRNPSITVSCEVTLSNMLEYRAIYISWIVYFVVLFLFHAYQSLRYPVNDLRYYIAMMAANASNFNQWYVKFGFLFTIVTVIVALVKTIENPVTFTGTNIENVLMFGVINPLLLKPFLSVPYASLHNMNVSESFPNCIAIDSMPPKEDASIFNFYGMFVSCDRAMVVLLRHLLLNKMDSRESSVDHLTQFTNQTAELTRAIEIVCLNRNSDYFSEGNAELDQLILNEKLLS